MHSFYSNQHKTQLLTRCFPFLLWANLVNRQSLWSDFLAGLTGAIVVLPQGIAYALIAGLPAEYGIYTAIITPIIAGLFGSSLHLISGPTAAISIVVLSVVSSIVPEGSDQFIAVALVLTLLVGLIQLAFGLARMGALVNFISHTVVIGFTAGAAVLIATSQLKHLLGIAIPAGVSFFESWVSILSQLNMTNPYSLVIGLITIAATIAIKKVNKKIPAMLFGMVAGSFICWLINGVSLKIPMVGSLSGQLPAFSIPNLSVNTLGDMLPGALAIAILGLVEAVSIARAIAIKSGQRIDGNQEFIGQGLSNITGSFLSCYAGSGSFTRTGVNFESGAKTPIAAIFAALILVLILLLFPQVTTYLPFPVMAGAILMIAWNLIDLHHIKQIINGSRQESTILAVTFIATLTVDLEFSIYLGVLLSLIFYLNRTANPTIMEVAPKSFDQGTDLRSLQRFQLTECPEIKIIRIDGSIFFGAVSHIQKKLSLLTADNPTQKHILIHCPGINFIDIAGAEMLYQESIKLQRKGYQLSFCALKNTVKDQLISLSYLSKLGEENFYATVDQALAELTTQLDQKNCKGCSKKIFKQCPHSQT